ncbi:MAG: hypothetical protein FJZ05_00820 [Candidatus Nealsonbacteria bacterium]|nr:hypothetical protein [Candidatus Nealsonbacteria bacterium]
MFYFLAILWLVRSTKASLFWFYLWQLKEYHIGRFLDHFNTYKGKKLVFNTLNIVKVVLLLIFIPYPVLVFFLAIFIYIFEALKTGWDIFRRKLKKPILTKKTAFLVAADLLVEFSILVLLLIYVDNIRWFAFWLLLFDVLMPVIVSLVVLIFQPAAVFLRNRIIQKAKAKRKRFANLLVIGVTGSYGKTSTKDFLAGILSAKYKVLKTKEHQNSEVGVSQCILNDLTEDHEVFVCEMGAYNVGGIKLLCDITLPKIGVLTGINEQHMATFGSQENIIKAKYELIESLPPDGLAFFNAKNAYCVWLYKKTKVKKFLYGQEAEFLGQENILGAAAVARELGVAGDIISGFLEKSDKMPGIKIRNGINGLVVLDSTYSANPDGVLANLEYLKSFPGKKIIIMPCLIELGQASEAVHLTIGQKIAEVCDLAIIITGDRFREIKEGAGKKALFLEKSLDIFERIQNFCDKGDVILLQSRVPKELMKLLIR